MVAAKLAQQRRLGRSRAEAEAEQAGRRDDGRAAIHARRDHDQPGHRSIKAGEKPVIDMIECRRRMGLFAQNEARMIGLFALRDALRQRCQQGADRPACARRIVLRNGGRFIEMQRHRLRQLGRDMVGSGQIQAFLAAIMIGDRRHGGVRRLGDLPRARAFRPVQAEDRDGNVEELVRSHGRHLVRSNEPCNGQVKFSGRFCPFGLFRRFVRARLRWRDRRGPVPRPKCSKAA